LSGRIPQSIGKLSNLLDLNLGRNQLTGPIPNSISNLLKLRALFLTGNKLSGIIPASIASFSSLNQCRGVSNSGLCRAESFTSCGTDIPGNIFIIMPTVCQPDETPTTDAHSSMTETGEGEPIMKEQLIATNQLTDESITIDESYITIEEVITPTETSSELLAVSSDETTASKLETSSVTQDLAFQSNAPGITLESVEGLNVDIPDGCFDGLGDLCRSNGVNVNSCSNSVVSDLLVDKVLTLASNNLGISPFAKDSDFSTFVTHNSTCKDNQEVDWVETYEITWTESREPNTTYQVAAVLLKQTFTAMSLLQVRINSFGTSSVQLACYFENGDALEFSSVPGGIVGGYTITEDVYDCSYYVTALDQSHEYGNSASLPFEVAEENKYPDLPNDVGLALEYLIVCIYVLVSAFGAYRSYGVYQLQRTRSDYKVNINIGFVALFSIWAFGNLLYMVLYSFALTETNFFYIKSVLTLTYFVTYFGFTLIIHYRYDSLELIYTLVFMVLSIVSGIISSLSTLEYS
jgi:hypothetical protein